MSNKKYQTKDVNQPKIQQQSKQPKEKKSKLMTLLPIVLILVAIPLSMLLWVGNVAFTVFWTGQSGKLMVYLVYCNYLNDFKIM